MAFTVHTQIPAAEELVALYRSVGWSAYTEDPERLLRALNGSHTGVPQNWLRLET